MRPSTLTSRLASERGTATATFWTADIPRVIRNASGGREHPCRGSVRIAGCLNMEDMGEAYPLPSLAVDPPDINRMATQQLMSTFGYGRGTISGGKLHSAVQKFPVLQCPVSHQEKKTCLE